MVCGSDRAVTGAVIGERVGLLVVGEVGCCCCCSSNGESEVVDGLLVDEMEGVLEEGVLEEEVVEGDVEVVKMEGVLEGDAVVMKEGL